MGKIRGAPYMRSHIFAHHATTKYFSNSFVFKTEIEKEGLPGDIAPALGAGGPRFKSGRPDHRLLFKKRLLSISFVYANISPLSHYQRGTIQGHGQGERPTR